MIPYAGHETEPPRIAHRPSRATNQMVRWLNWFRTGQDTKQIADAFGIDEHVIHYGVNLVRSQMRGLPSPYRKTGASNG